MISIKEKIINVQPLRTAEEIQEMKLAIRRGHTETKRVNVLFFVLNNKTIHLSYRTTMPKIRCTLLSISLHFSFSNYKSVFVTFRYIL